MHETLLVYRSRIGPELPARGCDGPVEAVGLGCSHQLTRPPQGDAHAACHDEVQLNMLPVRCVL